MVNALSHDHVSLQRAARHQGIADMQTSVKAIPLSNLSNQSKHSSTRRILLLLVLLPPPLLPKLPQHIVQKHELTFPLHHHDPLHPQPIHYVSNWIKRLGNLIQRPIFKLRKQPIQRDERPRPPHASAAMHDARRARRRVERRRVRNQRDQRRLILALGDQKVRPAGKEEVVDDLALALVRVQLHLPHRAPRLVVPPDAPERQAGQKVVLELVDLGDVERRRLQRVREVLEAFFAPGLVGLRQHDDDAGVARFVPDHAPDVAVRVFFGALGRDEVLLFAAFGAGQADGRGVDIVAVTFGNFELDAVVEEGVDVDVAVAFGDVVAGYACPLGVVGGGLSGGAECFGEAFALEPFQVEEAVMNLCIRLALLLFLDQSA